MPLLFTNARIITATDDYTADLYAEGETVSRIARRIDPRECPGAEVIDAAGKFLFPGFIDPHVHIYLPFMGTYAKDTWETAGRAALVGGTTTLVEMICPAKTDEPLAAYELWESKPKNLAPCDYAFHMGVTRFDALAEQQLRQIVERGTTSFKVFLAYKGALGVDDRELYHTLRLARELGCLVTAHCENETLVDERQKQLLAEGKTGPGWHEPSRPVQVEAAGVAHLCAFAELTRAPVYIVHTSCDEAVRQALAARARGVRVWIETVLPHLLLDKSYTECATAEGATARPSSGAAVPPDPFFGARYVMSPPLRDHSQLDKMWSHLAARTVSTIGTDHAPFDFKGQKEMGRPPKSDFTRIPNGIPSVEDRVNLLYTKGVAEGRISLNTLVDCASTQPARLFGLRGKGTIAVGADADLVLYDPAYRGQISAKTHHMATDYSAFEGWELKGRPALVTLRGQIMARDGKFTGKLGHGRRVPRDRPHAT